MDYENLTDEEFLRLLHPLTLTQYDECKANTIKRIEKLIGNKPERKAMQRDLGPLLNPLDWLAIVVFIAAFLISSIHILTHIGILASGIFLPRETGIVFYKDTFVVIHQIGFVFLAESSMLLFMTTWRIAIKKQKNILLKILNPYLVLSFMAMGFVFLANVAAGLTFFEGIMPPIFTIGLSLNLERLIAEFLDRRNSVSQKYLGALDIWEKSMEDPTAYPNYKQLLMREIWERLTKHKNNQEFADATARQKILAVNRELARDVWAEQSVSEVISSNPLLDFAKLVKHSKEEFVKTEYAEADLENLIWKDLRYGKQYGPYKTKDLMLLAIKRFAKE